MDYEPAKAAAWWRGDGRLTADAAASFDPLRPRLMRLAYRMLGSVADAEDMVQEAFIRWMATDRARGPRARGLPAPHGDAALPRSAQVGAPHRRETYVGPWLPEPLVEEEPEDGDVTLPLMLALERLSPLERAAFLLHDVFGQDFEEVAEDAWSATPPPAASSLRGRAPMSARRGRALPVDKATRARTRQRFLRGLAQRRHERARARCSPTTSASIRTAAASAMRPRTSSAARDHVIKLHKGLAVLYAQAWLDAGAHGFINGLPGFVTMEAGGVPDHRLRHRGWHDHRRSM